MYYVLTRLTLQNWYHPPINSNDDEATKNSLTPETNLSYSFLCSQVSTIRARSRLETWEHKEWIAQIGFGSTANEKMTVDEVNGLFRQKGGFMETIFASSVCAVLCGHVTITDETTKDTVLLENCKCQYCGEDLRCTIGDILDQPNFAGLDYEEGGENATFKCKVEQVTERMDAEELAKQQRELQRRQEMKRSEEQQWKEQQKLEEEKRELKKKTRQLKVEQSALAKLNALKNCNQPGKKDDDKKSSKSQKHQAKVENLLSQEEKRPAEQSEKLAPHQQHESAMEVKTDSSTMHVQQEKKSASEEEHTIQLLQQTITRQEELIRDVEEKRIPDLNEDAKAKLKAGKRKEAMTCVYRKKKLQRSVEVLNAGIFKMETQILRLDAAIEDREVAQVMQEATDAMEVLQGDVNANDFNHFMEELAGEGDDEMIFDEEELLNELLEDPASSQVDEHLPGSQDILDSITFLNCS